MMYRLLNLGAGTQSSVLLLMSERGELERLDGAVFADTGWEPQQVYDHLDWLRGHTSIPIHVVQQGNIYRDSIEMQVTGSAKKKWGCWGSMPLFVRNKDGGRGMVKRQCTYEYKIRPIDRFVKHHVLGQKSGTRWPTTPSVEKWYGMSLDELTRMRTPDRPCFVNRYPLIEMRMHRAAVIKWAMDNYPGHEFPRSACVGCPFRSDREWQWVKDNDPEGFESACVLDEQLRNAKGMKGEVYLHSSLRPLREVQFVDKRQLTLWDEECYGMCGS